MKYLGLGMPSVILVELTNRCNLRCPVCPTTHGMTREKGFMDKQTFSDLLWSLKRNRLRPRLRFTFAGEPMLHKEIGWFIEQAHRAHMRTDICTNGMIYHRFGVSPSTMTVDIDGIGEAHEKYRIGSDFGHTIENIKRMVEENPATMFTMQSLITKWSEGQEGELIELAGELGIYRIRFKNVHTGHGFVEGAEDIRPVFDSNRRKFRWTPICLSPKNHVVCYWDGSIGLCCVDYNRMCGSVERIDCKFFVERVGYLWRDRLRAILKAWPVCRTCEMSGAKGMTKEVWL